MVEKREEGEVSDKHREYVKMRIKKNNNLIEIYDFDFSFWSVTAEVPVVVRDAVSELSSTLSAIGMEEGPLQSDIRRRIFHLAISRSISLAKTKRTESKPLNH